METTTNPLQYESVVREMIWHEDEVVHHRMTWMTTLNGLLFTALGFLWGKASSRYVIILICVLGIFVCISCYILLVSATHAMRQKREWWEAHKPKDYDGPGVIGLVSLGPKKIHRLADYVAPWDAMALVLSLTWLLIAFVAVWHWSSL
jgi:hypothetical protein